jgi:hypothetical protein
MIKSQHTATERFCSATWRECPLLTDIPRCNSCVRLEIYFKDSRSLLIVFLMEQKRAAIDQQLSEIIGRHSSEIPLTPGLPRTPKTPKTPRIGSRVMSGFRVDELSAAQRKWQSREISNVGF